MNRRIGATLFAVALAMFALGFLAQWPAAESVSGQTVPDCGTAPCSPTPTNTPTNTPTATAVPFFLSIVYNYYGDKHVTVFLNPSPWCVTGNSYKVDVDFGNGVTITLGLPSISCPPNASPYQIDAGIPNYPPGLYALTAKLFETAPASRLIGQAQSVADTRPTATPTNTLTPTITNTPFVVSNRQFMPRIFRR